MTTGTFIGIVLAITVFAVICIVTDSFFFFKDKPGPYFVMFLFVIAVNLLIALGNIAEGIPFLTDECPQPEPFCGCSIYTHLYYTDCQVFA